MTTTQQPPPEPKHIAHNRRLLQQVLVREKVFSQYPRVSEQVELFPLQTEKLFKGGYNPCINAVGEMVYRFHKSGLASTKLARAILGKDGAVFANHELTIAGGIIGEDDPKLFNFQGEQYLSWVESDWAQTGIPTACCVKYAKFKDGKLSDFQWPRLPGNDGKSFQKNYVFFENEGRLFCVYQCHPTHRIYEFANHDNDKDPSTVYETDAPRWCYGDIRGGTPPLPYEGKLLRFFHSRINNNLGSVPWRYFIGAYLMEPEPPFKVVRVSKRPILYGSEVGTVKKKDCHHFKANVVFVSGVIETHNGWMCAIGENDSAALLCRIKPEQLNF